MDKQENKNVEPVMLSAVEDAAIVMGKMAESLQKIAGFLKPEEIIELEEAFTGISFASMVILMDAQETMKQREEEVK